MGPLHGKPCDDNFFNCWKHLKPLYLIYSKECEQKQVRGC
nr:MAG TPA: hypothetical protein [Caudoviricetes sp.]